MLGITPIVIRLGVGLWRRKIAIIGSFEAYGVLGQTIHWWIERSRKPGFYFLDPKYIQKKRPKEESKAGMKSAKPLMTPDGVFPTMRAAAEHYGVIKDSIRNWLKKKPHEFYLLEKVV